MDRDSRSIILALAAVLGIAALALIAAVLVPFKVERGAVVVIASGEIELLDPEQPPVPLKTGTGENEAVVLKVGQGLRLQPGSTATLSFDLNKGRAILYGPAVFTLRDSYRRATLPGHAFGHSSRQYTLTIEQTSGSVHYNFAHTDPPFEDQTITIQLPDKTYTPDRTAPCWIIDISAEGTSTIQTVNCSS